MRPRSSDTAPIPPVSTSRTALSCECGVLLHRVAGYPGGSGGNGSAAAEQAVEERGLADVGAADDGHEWHGLRG